MSLIKNKAGTEDWLDYMEPCMKKAHQMGEARRGPFAKLAPAEPFHQDVVVQSLSPV